MLIKGAYIVLDVSINGKTIQAIGVNLDAKPGAHIIHAAGNWLVPGFIDVHVHGAGGADVFDGSEEALQTLSSTLAKLGTTAFVATTMVRMRDNSHIRCIADHVGKDLGGARLLGLHLEGPFINSDKRGGILPESIFPFTDTAWKQVHDLAGPALKMMTVAPELPDSDKLIHTLLQSSIVPALGHSDCTFEEAQKSFEQGIRHVTHLFNAMPGLHHRFPGPIVAVLLDDRVTVQMICDGIHVHPAILKWIYRAVGSERVLVVTDGMSSLGMPDGVYRYNGKL